MTTKAAAATRTNVKTSTRYNDTMQVGDWTVSFDYEKEDGVLGRTLSAQATKEGKSAFISKNQGNLSVNFTNGTDFDAALVEAVTNEFNEIAS